MSANYGIYVLLIFTFLSPCTSFFFTILTPAKIEPPGDVIRYVGESFTLNCSAVWLNTTPTSFFKDGQGLSNIQTVDNKTIKLDIHNATLTDSGEYICRGTIGSSLSSLDIKNVLITYPLQPPVFITCVNYDGQSMNCSFQLICDPDEMLLEDVTVSYSIGNSNEIYLTKDRVTLKNRTTIICEWKNDDTDVVKMFNNKLIHTVKIVLTSRKNTISSLYSIDPYIYVKPGQVKKLNVQFDTTKTSVTANVKWSPPSNQDACQTGNLIYNVRIVRNGTVVYNTQITPDCSKQDLSASVSDLVPYTTYTVTVQYKPINDGYWSDETKIQTTTPITAPTVEPGIRQEFYTAVSNPDGSRTVAVYWKDFKLDERGGPIQNYIIKIPSLYMPRLISRDVRSVIVDLPRGEQTVHLQARTSAGSSPFSSLIIPVHNKDSLPLIDVVVEKIKKSRFNIIWGKVNNQHPNKIQIYYCYGQLSQTLPIVKCLTSLSIPYINYTENSALVTTTETRQCKDCELYFAVSMKRSYGLIWSVCYFYYFGDVAEPTVSVSVGVDNVKVKWQRKCSRTKSQPILLQISYQQYQYNTTNCSNGKRVNVSTETVYNIQGLISNTNYMLCLRTFSNVDVSEWTVKNITTSPIVTETEVNYMAIFLPTGLVLFFSAPFVCMCIWKARGECKHRYHVKTFVGETRPDALIFYSDKGYEVISSFEPKQQNLIENNNTDVQTVEDPVSTTSSVSSETTSLKGLTNHQRRLEDIGLTQDNGSENENHDRSNSGISPDSTHPVVNVDSLSEPRETDHCQVTTLDNSNLTLHQTPRVKRSYEPHGTRLVENNNITSSPLTTAYISHKYPVHA